ncbi:MAG: DUF1533 domain-containing protein [Clostridia bacterium]|nr:DUF1533 domain-containing protein [Clostridia bacterium]
MPKKLRKVMAACIALIYAVSIITSTVYAAPSDISGHPAASTINRWIAKGLAKTQSDGKFKPNEIIKRIEFITFINKVFNFTEKAKINVVDVISGSDDGNEVAKAVAAGYLQADGKKKVYPYQPVAKADAAVMLAKVFDLKSSNTSNLNKYSDSDKIPYSSKEAISALDEKGYISGSSDGKFSPWSNLTRADAIVIIDKIIGDLFNAKGTYKGSYKGNVVVSAESVNLKDTVIEGDLYLTEGIGDGDVTLDKVTVKGRTIVRGGGKHSIIIRNSSLWGPVSVAKRDGLIRLVAEGTTNIYNVQLNSGAILEENGVKTATGYKGFEEIQINRGIAANQEMKFEGDFSNINIEAASVNIQVDGTVGKLQLRESGENTIIKVRSGTVSELLTQADKTVIEATGGTITSLKVSNTAAASTVTVDGASVGTLDVQASSNINISNGTIGTFNMHSGASGSTVSIGKDARVPSFSTSGVAVRDNRTITTGNSTQYISISAQNLTVTKDNVAAAVVNVTPVDAVLNYNSLNPAIATVNPNNGVVKGESLGTATIIVTATKTGYTTVSTTFTVTVNAVNNNPTAAGTLLVSPANANRSAVQSVTLSYTPGEALSNGTVVFTLPTGFTASTSDTVSIAGGTAASLNASQISNSGSTITITGLNLTTSQTVVVTLVNKTIPAANNYTFSAAADADGTGTRGPSSGSGNETKIFTSNSVTLTLPGSLVISPASGAAGSTQDVTLTYTLAESMNSGSVVFTLPSGFTPNAGDIVYVNGVTTSAITIVGQTVTVTGVTAASGQNIVLILDGRTVPAAGNYDFRAVADADGVGGTKNPSTGTGSEAKIFTSNTSVAPSVITAVNATVDSDFNLTFTDNPAWRNGITVITVGGTALPSSAYSITSAGSITLKPSQSLLLQTPGTKTISISSTNFASVTVSQVIAHGAAKNIVITTQPTAPASNGGVLAAQPVLRLKDQYNNDCSTDNTTQVNISRGDAGNWSIGGITTVSAVNGTVTFSDLTASSSIQVSGARLRFSSTGLADMFSNTFTVPAPSIVVTPAANATVDGNFDITFAENATWRAAITAVSVGGTVLPAGAYDISSAGRITLRPSQSTLLQSSGTKTITITAAGFAVVSIDQPIKHGAATRLDIQVQPQPPTASGTQLSVQPVIRVLDQYNNICSTDNTTQVVAAKGDGGTWTLGGTLTATAVNGTISYTNLTAARNAQTDNAYIRFTSGSLTAANSNTFTILANTGNETAAVTSPANNSYSNADLTTITGTATNTNSDLVKVVVRIKDNATQKYLSANNGGLFSSNTPVDLTVSGTTSWTVTLSSISFSNGNYTIEAIANDGANGLTAFSVFTIDKAAPYRINAVASQQNTITGNNGYITLTTVNDPLSNATWINILNEIKAHTAVTSGSWISGIDPSYLDIDPSADGVTAKLINKDSGNAAIVADFVIPAARVADRAGNVASGNITIDAYIGAPEVASITAAEGGAAEHGIGPGDTLTIVFNVATNKAAATVYADKNAVDAVINWGSKSFGSAYTGNWTDNRTLVITCSNGSGATFMVGDTIVIKSGAGIKTQDGLSAASSDTSEASTGTFNPAPAIVSISAAEGGPALDGLDAGDTITIKFDVATNKAAATVYADKNAVDAVINWGSKSFGTSYSGQWTDNKTLVITCINGSGATFAVGDTITVKVGADIRTLDGTSPASTDTSDPSEGTFDLIPPAPVVLSITAAEGGASEHGIGPGDTLTIIFDTATNKTASTSYADKAAVDTVINWGSKSFGTSYTGVWTNNTTLVITCTNGAGATFTIGDTITIRSGAGIKTPDNLSPASNDISDACTGAFSPAPVIVSVTAAEGNPGSNGLDAGDTITIVFNTATNKTAAVTYADKAAVDAVINWGSKSFGLSYTGAWTDNKTLVITCTDGSTADFAVGNTITIKAGAEIKTLDESSPASTDTSDAAEGTFDLIPAAPLITSVTAAEGGTAEHGIGSGDTLTIVFNAATNKTGGTSYANKTAVDAIINWGSKSFGSGYTGAWTDNRTLVITCTNGSGATFTVGDTIAVNSGADIKTQNGLSSASTDTSDASTGTFNPAPLIVSVTATEAGAEENGIGPGDILTVVFDVATNKEGATYANKTAVDAVINWGGKSFGSSYTGAWTDNKTLVITCVDGSTGDFAVGNTITVKTGGDIRTLDGTSQACTDVSDASTGTFSPVPLAPTVVSIATNEAGSVITIEFNKTMANPSGKHAQFGVLVDGTARTVSAAALNTDNKKIDLTLSTPVAVGNTITLSYTPGTVAAADGGALALFTGSSVTNSVVGPAKIASVSSSVTNNTYGAGQVITITVTFDTAVDISTVGGIPTLRVETGTVDEEARYIDGNRTNVTTLTFEYTVKQGNNTADLEYVSTASLALNGATVKNTGKDVAAILSLPALGSIYSLGGQKNIAIDTTAPVNATGFPKAGTKTENTANVLVQVNESGKAYYVVLDGGASAPTASQIKAGRDASNVNVAKKGEINLTAGMQGTISITGLDMLTSYDIYVVSDDWVGNLQSIPGKVSVITTNDITPPVITGSTATPGGITADIEIITDEESRVYYIVMAGGSPAPTAANVKAGAGALSASLKGYADTAGNRATINLNGLNGLTTYDLYVVCQDNNNNLQTTATRIQVTTDLTGVTADVAAGKLSNTSRNMEYSLDSTNGTNGTWTGCTDGTTTVQFTVGDVYIRDKSNTATARRVATVTQQPMPTTAQINGIGYNIAQGTLTGTLSSMQYRINGGAWIDITTGGAISGIAFAAGDLEFRIKATATTLASLPVTKVTISAPASAPLLMYDDVVNTILDLNSVNELGEFIYEYRIDTGGWTSGGVTPDLSGTKTVYVRKKATATELASQVQVINFTVNVNLNTVGINIAVGQIYGTTTAMEYSLNSTDGYNGTWKPCSNTNTNVTFVEGNVYIRASAQRDNVRLIDTLTAPAAPATVSANETGGQNAVKLVGATTSMEYSRDGGITWYAVSTSIAAGTQSIDVSTAPNNDLRVRLKATTTKLASRSTGKLNNTGTIAVSQQAALTMTVVGANQTIQLSDMWKITAAKESVVLDSIKVDISGTMDTVNVDNLVLMYSTNVAIGDADDVQIGTSLNPGTGASELEFTALSKTVAVGSGYIYILGQISSSASTGQNIALGIPAEGITATGVVSSRAIKSTGIDAGTVVTLDNTPPTAAITYNLNRAVKSGDTLVITATFNKAMANAPVVQISISGANTLALTNMTKVDATHYTCTYTVGAGDGAATVALATGTDLSGNVITAAPVSGATFTVDNTVPGTPVITLAEAKGNSEIPGYMNSSNLNLQIDANINGSSAAGGSAELLIDGVPFSTPVIDSTIGPMDTSVSFLVAPGVIGQGTHTFSIRLKDEAGNSATSMASSPVIVDYSLPSKPSVSYTVVGGSVVAGYINDTNTGVNFSADIVAGEATGGTAELLLGTTVVGTQPISANDTTILLTVSKAVIGTEGSKSFTVRVTDVAGNTVTSNAISLVADFTSPGAPTAPSIAGNDNIKVSGYVNGTNSQISASSTIIKGDAVGGRAELLIDGVSFSVKVQDLSIGSNDIAVSLLSAFASVNELRNTIDAGTHKVKVRLFDAAGNYTDSSETSFTADYTSPSVPANVAISAQGNSVVAGYFNISNNGIVAAVDVIAGQAEGGYAELIIDGRSFGTPIKSSLIGAVTTHVAITYNFADLNELKALIPAGTHTFAVRVYTLAGNFETSSTVSLIADYTAPGAPSSVTISGTGGKSVTGYLNGTNNQISANVRITAGQATGGRAELVIGSTVVATYNINSGDSNIAIVSNYLNSTLLQAAIPDSGAGSGERSYTATVRIVDAAGNSVNSTPVSFKADYIVPDEPAGGFTITASGGTVVSGRINETNMYIKVNSISITSNQAIGGKAELVMDKGTPGQRIIAVDNIINTSDTTLTLSSNFSNPAALQAAIPEGSHEFVIVLYDAAGNSVETAATVLIADYP